MMVDRMRARTHGAALVAVLLLVLSGCTGSGPSHTRSTPPPSTAPPASTGWTAVPAPAAGARVRVLQTLGVDLLALGSVPSGAGRAPGAWITRDLRTWTRVPLTPVTGYGKQAEFIRAGVTGGRISAFGQATGGAHGSPRPTMWTGTASGLTEHVQSFTLFGGEDAISQNGEAAGPHGVVIVGSWDGRNGYGAAVWTSPDGADWTRYADSAGLASRPGEQTSARDAAGTAGGFVLVGDTLPDYGAQRALAWISTATPTAWSRVVLPSAPGGAATAARVACAGAACYVIGTAVSSAPRLLCWRMSATGSGARVGAEGPGGALLEPGQVVVGSRQVLVEVDTDRAAELYSLDRSCSSWRAIVLPDRSPHAAVGLLGTRLVVATTGNSASHLWVRG